MIAGMESDARAEAEQIVNEAEVKAAEKIKYANQKVEAVLKEARTKADDQAESVKRKIVSGVELEAKRKSLYLQGLVIQDIMKRVERQLAGAIDTKEYKSALRDWTAEAAMGLDCEAATVNASQNERAFIDADFLTKAAKEVKQKTGRRMSLSLSEDEPLAAQGVVVTAADGRTAYNNQVKTRIRRKQQQIQALIHDTMFAEKQEE